MRVQTKTPIATGVQKARVRDWMARQGAPFRSADLAAALGLSPSTAAVYVSRAHREGILTRDERRRVEVLIVVVRQRRCRPVIERRYSWRAS